MARPGNPRPDLGVDAAYAPLKARIIARTGHHYYTDKDELLIERLHRRFRAAAVADCAAYAALLSSGAEGEAEWARLEAEITVGETFFFRYAEQFNALRATILPALIAARASERVLRIWSAGCSTGAEPYSLAILVHELLGDALPDWRVAILGTDISVEALATARAAEYGRWALRTMPPEDRLRYFTRLPVAPGIRREGGYALRPEYRGSVRFERGNLLTLVEPGPPQGEPFDLILCRNVLIYFDARTVAAVVRGLGRRLRPEGWLLLGHAEPSPAFASFLDAVSLPGTVAYRPRAEAPPAGPPGMPAPDPAPPARQVAAAPAPDPGPGQSGAAGADTAAVPAPNPDAAPGAAPLPAAPETRDDRPEEDDAVDLDRIRALADSGETGAAWRALRVALDRDPTDTALRFYEGLLARTLGRDAEAERALRAALYLDRGFVMAHYHLGLLLIALRRPHEAVRALDNAVALSQALGPDTALPEGDGASAGEIAASAAAARAALGAAGSRRS
ncbi:protein-glutamate O-methyltransferase CheR [Methylobacterium sp. NMS14P]|uniref:CheR family methyltransferase n=1 Tax=unclassified Methylobacterium TaxID=2615210 RepID=UPI0023581F8D|nr:protein-glutamate O-methyltransferase CheR [Methylobacterium sp. NMS14P]WCS27470.1 protein-glutamate O-methyltransferase CheR [Methylobacterium sp. NMS14P]